MKFLATLYIAGCLTLVGVYLIRRTDKYFWKGVAYGLLLLTAYIIFLSSVGYLLYD